VGKLAQPAAVAALTAVTMGAACGTEPGAPTSVASAVPVLPATGAVINFYTQPVTLVVTNGVTTGVSPLMLTFEVATDAQFAHRVFTRDVPQADGGRTSVTLDPLPADTTYTWRVRTAAAETSAASPSSTFTLGSEVVIDTPTPIQPINDGLADARPTLTVRNAAHRGPAGALVYRFDISPDASFTATLTSGTALEGGGTTSFTSAAEVPLATLLYWRARAQDTASGVVGAASAPQRMYATRLGTRPARLTLHEGSQCKPSRTRDYEFDGTLVDTGATLALTLPRIVGPSADRFLTLDLTRTANAFTGMLQGSYVARNGWEIVVGGPASVGTQPTGVASVAGSVVPDGRLSGTFDGSLRIWTPFSDDGSACVSRFTFDVAPTGG